MSPQKTVHVVANEAALKALCDRLRLGGKLHGNLRQLCNWDKVGDDRDGRGLASGWALIESVKWLRRAGSEFLYPAIGKVSDIMKAIPDLQAEATPGAVKKLLNGQTKTVGGLWTCLNPGSLPPPAFALNLSDGDSLFGHRPPASQAVHVDYADVCPVLTDTDEVRMTHLCWTHIL